MSGIGEMPWHPFLVHFPIGVWVWGTLFLWVALGCKRPEWEKAAWACLAFAAVMSLLAALSGQSQYDRLADTTSADLQTHRRLGTFLPWLLLSVVALRIHAGLTRNTWNRKSWLWCLLAGLGMFFILWAGLSGGKLVYLLGLVGGPQKGP